MNGSRKRGAARRTRWTAGPWTRQPERHLACPWRAHNCLGANAPRHRWSIARRAVPAVHARHHIVWRLTPRTPGSTRKVHTGSGPPGTRRPPERAGAEQCEPNEPHKKAFWFEQNNDLLACNIGLPRTCDKGPRALRAPSGFSNDWRWANQVPFTHTTFVKHVFLAVVMRSDAHRLNPRGYRSLRLDCTLQKPAPPGRSRRSASLRSARPLLSLCGIAADRELKFEDCRV